MSSAESPRHRGRRRARRRRPVRLRPVQSRRRPRRDTRPVGFGCTNADANAHGDCIADGVPGERRRMAAVPLHSLRVRRQVPAVHDRGAIDPTVDPCGSNRLAVAGQRHLRGLGRDHGHGHHPACRHHPRCLDLLRLRVPDPCNHAPIDLGTKEVGGYPVVFYTEDPTTCGGTSAFVLVGDRLYDFFIGLPNYEPTLEAFLSTVRFAPPTPGSPRPS